MDLLSLPKRKSLKSSSKRKVCSMPHRQKIIKKLQSQTEKHNKNSQVSPLNNNINNHQILIKSRNKLKESSSNKWTKSAKVFFYKTSDQLQSDMSQQTQTVLQKQN